MIHVRNQNANIEPVFFSYPADTEMDMIVREWWKTTRPNTISPRPTGFAISSG